MKPTTPLAITLALCGLHDQAKAEQLVLACVVSSTDAPPQSLFVKVSDGNVFYGASMDSLIAAQSMNKGSLSVSNSHVAFRQTWPANHVQWDWNIDRDTGNIAIKYIDMGSKRTFLTKKGSCTGA
ncbi:MAG: hypothetical protein WB816_02675 [Methylocystis sp.]